MSIIVNMKDIDDDIELAEKLCDYAKKMWNTKHDIKIEHRNTYPSFIGGKYSIPAPELHFPPLGINNNVLDVE